MSNSLWPYELQHTWLPCPLSSPGVYSNLCPLSRWCHPTISSSIVPFSSCLQSFPASGFFPMNQFFTPGSQSGGASTLTLVLPRNTQGWFPLGLTGLISLHKVSIKTIFWKKKKKKTEKMSQSGLFRKSQVELNGTESFATGLVRAFHILTTL